MLTEVMFRKTYSNKKKILTNLKQTLINSILLTSQRARGNLPLVIICKEPSDRLPIGEVKAIFFKNG